MKSSILRLLVCPECRGALSLIDANTDERGEVHTGTLRCAACDRSYPVLRGIPRFVDEENYTQSFAYQWTKFSKTQLDENLGIPLSAERFSKETRWPPVLSGDTILEAGSGMGRFTRCAAATGAEVFSFDYSAAIDANYDNNKHLPNVHFVQADIRKPPFRDSSFDRVFCFGVIQHTPDPQQAFRGLIALTKAGGSLVADVYRRTWKTAFWGQYYLRVFTRRVPPEKLFPLVESYFNIVHRLTGWILPINEHASKVLSLMLGTADYRGMYSVPADIMREWCLLDTFDKLSPAFDYPQTERSVSRWFDGMDVQGFEVMPGYNGLEIHVRR